MGGGERGGGERGGGGRLGRKGGYLAWIPSDILRPCLPRSELVFIEKKRMEIAYECGGDIPYVCGGNGMLACGDYRARHLHSSAESLRYTRRPRSQGNLEARNLEALSYLHALRFATTHTPLPALATHTHTHSHTHTHKHKHKGGGSSGCRCKHSVHRTISQRRRSCASCASCPRPQVSLSLSFSISLSLS